MNFVYFLLLSASLVLVQCLIGGTQAAYSFPPYALAALAAVLSVVSLRRPAVKVSTACMASTLLLAAYVLARAWYSPNAYLAHADAFLAAACLVVYLLTALYITQTRHRMWIVGALLAVAAAHIVIGALQFKSGDNWYLRSFGFYIPDEPIFRSSGMMVSGNHMAGYLEAMALFALSITIWSRCQIQTKLVTGYLVLACYAGVAMSGSRGGYLSSVFSLLVFAALALWIVRIVNRQRFLLTLIGTCVGLVLLLGVAATLMTQSHTIKERLRRLGNATQDVRYYNWLATIDQFKLSPLLGTGSGTHLYYGRLFRRPQIQTDPEHSHGDYLEMLAEYGLVGEGLAVAFLILHFAGGIQSARQVAHRRLCNTLGRARSDTLALTLGSLGAVAALMSHSVVDFNMHIPGNALLFAFIFGMLSSPGIERTADGVPATPQLFLRGALALTGLGLLAAIEIQFKGEQLANQSRLALKSHDYTECNRLATLAIEAAPTNPRSYFYQGESARATAAGMSNYAAGEPYFEQAIEAYTQGLQYFSQDENLWIRLAQSLDGLYRFEEAEAAYREAIELDPNLGVLYAYYGAHLRLSGDAEGAKKCEDAAKILGASDLHEIGMGERPTLPTLYLEKATPPPDN